MDLAAIMHRFERTDPDLTIRLVALQVGCEVRARVPALAAPVDSRVAYHGTDFMGLVGILNGFRNSPAYPERCLGPLVYVTPEMEVGWRYPMNLWTGEYIAGDCPI